jgi:alpha-ketoglutarate-dependent taurine dioxygenase
MRNRRIEVRPIAGALGAEIHGVDLAVLDDEAFADIHEAWLEHLVLFFRDQQITPAEQVAFARRFGEIHYHPYMRGLDEQPEILEIVREPGDSYTFGGEWHTDQMFNPKPAKATMLYAKETPSAGGDTMFANMYLAYDTLSEGLKQMLAKARSHCLGNRSKRRMGGMGRAERYANNPAMLARLREPTSETPTEARHPLLRTHPETGRKALYIGSHVHSLDGFAEAEVDALIDYLRAHSVKPEFTCRFAWRPGSLAIWDNRCTQHHAIADYNERRRMHRITIAGDEPY